MLSTIIYIITFVVVLLGGGLILISNRLNFVHKAVGLTVLLVVLFVGARAGNEVSDYEQHYSETAVNSAIAVTEYHFTEDELIYDTNTNIIYIRSKYATTPYLSENGNYCRYLDGEIVEITS